jgi:hypothetical protein|tara:strand:+ start:1065 stop:1283 length:219 start_codon:yes stop_codon:yes gene_type:complete
MKTAEHDALIVFSEIFERLTYLFSIAIKELTAFHVTLYSLDTILLYYNKIIRKILILALLVIPFIIASDKTG